MLPATAPTVDAYATIARRRRARAGSPTRQHSYSSPAIVLVVGHFPRGGARPVAALSRRFPDADDAKRKPDTCRSGTLIGRAFISSRRSRQPACAAVVSPLAFIMAEWREGYIGALLMGLRHGLICVGCCWAVMSLMFCVSVMDLRWAAALAVYAAVEKYCRAATRSLRRLSVRRQSWAERLCSD